MTANSKQKQLNLKIVNDLSFPLIYCISCISCLLLDLFDSGTLSMYTTQWAEYLSNNVEWFHPSKEQTSKLN